jgi:pyruvate,orthophosphate dikinase
LKIIIHKTLGQKFPDDPWQQLWGGIEAVFASWNGKRAVEYRKIEHIPDEWGTAVNVQVMVYGNMGEDSCTGVGFTRNPATGENKFYGEYLVNAQGEDVVAGIRTPAPINRSSANDQSNKLETLQKKMPKLYKELDGYQRRLEKHYRDMQDIEFTIERGTLYMLQCRTGKRNGQAAIRMAMDMYREKLIDAKTALMRVSAEQLQSVLLPSLTPAGERAAKVIAKGLPAGPGGASGRLVFTSSDAVQQVAAGGKVVLVREETSPEDVQGMHVASAILTTKGGMTSHAALVARGWGKCCIVGCADITINLKEKKMITRDGLVLKEGDFISLNGTKGIVYAGTLPLSQSGFEKNKYFHAFMELTNRFAKMEVRANAETKLDAQRALAFGAKGIGLFRTEHIFYGKGSEAPLLAMQKMILSATPTEREKALNELFPFMKKDIRQILEIMEGYPVTIRLLDPPLHEFLPHEEDKIKILAEKSGIPIQVIQQQIQSLRETNPMLGHRGVRLAISYPEITMMQVKAIFEACAELIKNKKKILPEIMVPVTIDSHELQHQKKIIMEAYQQVCKEYKLKSIPFHFGTMIETPRAAILANELAIQSDFFSFGTNDLTQMTFGFSRDDIGSFLPEYIRQNMLPADPFAHIDTKGVGQLIESAVTKGKKVNRKLEIGVCGEHAGDPESIRFFTRSGVDYLSCSPFRVPIARLVAAQGQP